MRITKTIFLISLYFFLCIDIQPALAEKTSKSNSDAEIAKQLANPIADLIHIPVQFNYVQKIGPEDDGKQLQINIQPVVPFYLNDEWNLISRTILPISHQKDIFPGAGSQFGLGDTTMSLFFSPKTPGSGGIIWGAGPIFQFPTATDSLLGSKKWGAGPSGIVLKQRGAWTVGTLGHHIWSFAGDNERKDLNFSFLQPFLAYTWPSAWSASLVSESSYNWDSKKWSIPLNFAVAKVVRFGKMPVRLQGAIGYWMESPDDGPEGFQFRLQANFVLPKIN